MCTGPLIYSLPLQWSYLYCTVVSQCNGPNCAMSQLVACHVVNVSCVCHALCDRFAVCCVQGNILLCQHVYMCIVLWSICHAFVMRHAIVPLCAVCKGACCCINMYYTYLYVPSVPSESHEFTLSQVAYMRVMNKSLSGLIKTV